MFVERYISFYDEPEHVYIIWIVLTPRNQGSFRKDFDKDMNWRDWFSRPTEWKNA